ncbi:MAG: molybdopterin-dependent oxidoreductase, partial [Acidimicrobiaceae bacterium]|nr:molybdopterin-dependent oxidoreductase [Acidimicrobiaceae bacterium]
RPVRMVYSREESFFGHVHRHPAIADVELGATRDGRLTFTKVRLVLDGGAYVSTSQVVIANGCYFAAGAYNVANVEIDGFATYTNNPPCGAMRGFGAVQSCYAIESAMDRLAAALDMHPLELRARNAIGEGDILPTGQAVDGPAPVQEILAYLRDLPLPADVDHPAADMRVLPGGVGNVTRGEGIHRGVGYALGMKAIGFSGGKDDTCTARVTVWIRDGEPVAEVYCAGPEIGQGVVTLEAQVARTELGVRTVELRDKDTDIAESGASSASRQTWMTAGAIVGACRLVREEILARGGAVLGRPGGELTLDGPEIRDLDGRPLVPVAEVLGPEAVSHDFTYRHRPTEPVDTERGQGNAHVAFAYAAHRAVVDVDVELGLVRVVEMATAQDVGKAMNPAAVEGQIEGGTVQGLGLAVMEELQITEGRVRNPSFTDYLIPTMLDVPPMPMKIFEFPHPDSPYGLNGVGEPPNLSSTPAILNALRDATGLELPRAPVRPSDLIEAAPAPGAPAEETAQPET